MTLDERLRYVLAACRRRDPLLDEKHRGAVRLFNGFLEGEPNLVVDLYGQTLVMVNFAAVPQEFEGVRAALQAALQADYPWLESVVVKTREVENDEDRRGRLVYGKALDRRIQEHGVWYAVDLQINLDASFYLDTRLLRLWALEHLAGADVLNTFAYTGSLGVAAQAGGARRVVHLDLNRRFLNLAKDSYSLNGFPIERLNFLAGDFWTMINRLKRSGNSFDCVFLDPPYFSSTDKGTVDMVNHSERVINKVRPLVRDGGCLVAVNNALFVSGEQYLHTLERLCQDGYLFIEQLIPVPQDVTGFAETCTGGLPADPTPFNHSTKIALLRVRRKSRFQADDR
jgi:23S rRNA (cytosine1962-C5)-methyltransferase